MAEYKSQLFRLKSGIVVVIRSATKQDAAAILDLSNNVIGEEIYQLTSSSEFKMTMEAEEKWIDDHLVNSNHLILVAEVNKKIVGILDFSNGHRLRIAHTGELGMSLEKAFRNKGIGTLLLKVLIDWATENETIEKIGLCVHSNNERAIALYKKMGFEVEGIRKRELKYSDQLYIDTIVMGRFL